MSVDPSASVRHKHRDPVEPASLKDGKKALVDFAIQCRIGFVEEDHVGVGDQPADDQGRVGQRFWQ